MFGLIWLAKRFFPSLWLASEDNIGVPSWSVRFLNTCKLQERQFGVNKAYYKTIILFPFIFPVLS